MTTDFERRWLRLLHVDRRAADRLRREHNHTVILQSLFRETEIEFMNQGRLPQDWLPKFPPEFAGEEIVRMENGKATTIRSTIPE